MVGASGSWIVRLGRTASSLRRGAGAADERDTVIFAGEAIDAWSPDGIRFDAVDIRIPHGPRPLVLTTDIVEFRCSARELPDDHLAVETPGDDHVVHLICSHFPDPDAIVRFLDHIREADDKHIEIRREAWLEVEAYPVDAEGHESTAPLIDDIFVALPVARRVAGASRPPAHRAGERDAGRGGDHDLRPGRGTVAQPHRRVQVALTTNRHPHRRRRRHPRHHHRCSRCSRAR